jgi:hypothetical protein
MRVFFAIFIFSMFRIWSVEAAEPIVVLTYGESRESFGSMQDEYRTHPMRVDPNAHKTHKVQEAETLRSHNGRILWGKWVRYEIC